MKQVSSCFILEVSVTSHVLADTGLIRCGCFGSADNRLPHRGQTNPRRGHIGTCGLWDLQQLVVCMCFSSVLENASYHHSIIISTEMHLYTDQDPFSIFKRDFQKKSFDVKITLNNLELTQE